MRLLFLSFAIPWPVDNGHKMRTWSVLEALAASGHEISLLTFGTPEEVARHEPVLQQVCVEVETVPLVIENLSSAMDYVGRLAALFSAQPFSVRRFVSPTMRARIEMHLARRRYDAVVCDSIYCAANLPVAQIPVVLNCHNVEYVLLQRYLSLERNPAKRLYAWTEMHKLRRWEEETGRAASMAMACSDQDKRLLSALCPELLVNVVPNVVATETYDLRDESDACTILFQGAMDWFPNRDAVRFFAERILPSIRESVPEARFVVAGRNPPSEFCKRFRNIREMEFTGTLADVRMAIAKATVCVVPLRIGSGTRLKILEAAAMGKAVVSTSVGAEGLEFLNEEEIILSDKPWEFAGAVIGLLQDQARRRAIGLAARRRVEAQYSARSLRHAMDRAFSCLPARETTFADAPDLEHCEARVQS
jgi:polysaccharide biosynthesis protein PslH